MNSTQNPLAGVLPVSATPVATDGDRTITRALGHAYRGDVDGLRAVAILSVLVYHAFPDVLAGGFIGVDIFFVISGFLITGIIIESIDAGRFSIADFYVRRVRRIFPALAVVLAACLAVGWFALLPHDFELLGKHVAGGAGFISNLVLWRESGYFDVDAELKPLLHLWSLGIEEQYYLAWPLLLLLVRRLRLGVAGMVAAIGLTSFALNIALVDSRPVDAFYLPFTRIWELMIGSAIALWRHDRRVNEAGDDDSPWMSALAFIGVIAIACALVLLNPDRAFPGWWALLVTGGTAAIIVAGPRSWLNRILLASRPMVFVGLISYPLYLWHWPLLAFANITHRTPSVTYRLAALGVSFGLAWLTYRVVEIPIRRSGSALRSRHLAIALAGLVAVIGAVGLASRWEWIPSKSAADPQLAAIAEAAGDWRYPSDRVIPGTAPGTVLFIGDSHLQHYFAGLERFAETSSSLRHTIEFKTSAGCAPIPKIERKGKMLCATFMKAALERARRGDVGTVVIAGSWFGFSRRQDYYAADEFDGPPIQLMEPQGRWVFDVFETMLRELRASGRRVVVVLDGPRDHLFDPKSRVYWSFLAIHARPAIPADRAKVETLLRPVNDLISAISIRAGAEVLRPMDWFCDRVTCRTADEFGNPIYMDESHVRASYSRRLQTPLEDIVVARSDAG
jgi:peptidoglycan/LPS O-acetylase OafA/YrhL